LIRTNIISAVIIGVALNGLSPANAVAFDEKVLNSVVSVLPNWLRWKQENSEARMPNAPEGTAVAIFKGGYLITNAHVLGPAKEVDIRLNNGNLLGVQIVGRDLRTDLALLKAPREFPAFDVAPAPKLGNSVCTAANQFGLGLSVTCGVVSALHRTGTGFNVIEDFVQTDAVVNPGGSGGALVDGDSRLVGMISAIFTKESDSNIGINFATSSKLLIRVATDLRDHGRVLWGNPGLRVGALNTDQRRKWSGAKILDIDPGGGAELAGLELGDIVTQIGHRQIVKPTDVVSEIAFYRAGEAVPISYLRGGQKTETTLTLKP